MTGGWPNLIFPPPWVHQRERAVSEEVMRRMAEKLKPPAFEEGFAKITVARVKSAG
jgi:hypothetical protein